MYQVPSRQEMFDLAVRGLASQGWQPALALIGENSSDIRCEYLTKEGRRCAWGWVDPHNTPSLRGDVQDLHRRGIGVAGLLDNAGTIFAARLQAAHDQPFITPSINHAYDERSSALLESMRSFGNTEHLVWPLDVPLEVPEAQS